MDESLASPHPNDNTINVLSLQPHSLLQWQDVAGGGILLGQTDPPSLISREDALHFAHQIIIGYDKMTDEGLQNAASHFVAELYNRRAVDTRHLYLIESAGYHKIGITRDPIKRLAELEKQSPFPMRIVYSVQSGAYREIEQALHRSFHERHHHGEWFDLKQNHINAIIEIMDQHAETTP